MNFKQPLTAVFGQPVAENPTQVMMEAAYRHHNLDWRYLTIEVAPADLADAVQGARAMGFAGFNCTLPHKVAVIEQLDELGTSASLMGAVNCVVRKGQRLIGENTDGKGFVRSLCEKVDPHAKRVVIFGAGGAARAIGVETALAGAADITIVNRHEGRGRELADLLNNRVSAQCRHSFQASFAAWKGDFFISPDTDIVINATSVGLFPDADARLPVELDSLRPNMLVADVIPNPPRTRLIRDSSDKGCPVIDGLEMLVNQGVIGIRYWSGVDADPSVMRGALENVFGKPHGSGTSAVP